jgi:hypothetical protein
MHTGHDLLRPVLDRRAFLVASGIGFCGLDLPAVLATSRPAT